MCDPATVFEANLERLLQSTCGPAVRATSAMGTKLRREWLAEVRRQTRPPEFPTAVLWVMSGVLALIAIISVVSRSTYGWSLLNLAITEPFGVLVLANLLCLPAASLVIILRRKYA